MKKRAAKDDDDDDHFAVHNNMHYIKWERAQLPTPAENLNHFASA